MKTVTIHTYKAFGTDRRFARCIYRNRELVEFSESDILSLSDLLTSKRFALTNKCKAWAECNGFTHFKAVHHD